MKSACPNKWNIKSKTNSNKQKFGELGVIVLTPRAFVNRVFRGSAPELVSRSSAIIVNR
jgi:hypothetical protein